MYSCEHVCMYVCIYSVFMLECYVIIFLSILIFHESSFKTFIFYAKGSLLTRHQYYLPNDLPLPPPQAADPLKINQQQQQQTKTNNKIRTNLRQISDNSAKMFRTARTAITIDRSVQHLALTCLRAAGPVFKQQAGGHLHWNINCLQNPSRVIAWWV